MAHPGERDQLSVRENFQVAADARQRRETIDGGKHAIAILIVGTQVLFP